MHAASVPTDSLIQLNVTAAGEGLGTWFPGPAMPEADTGTYVRGGR